MKTLKEVVEDSKCRKGPAWGTTDQGAYWQACHPIEINVSGGNGIGQNAPYIKWSLELRHFRSGEVRPTLNRSTWHQNGVVCSHKSIRGGGGEDYYDALDLANCVSIEEVIIALKKMNICNEKCISDRYTGDINTTLTKLGMVRAERSPDEDRY